MGFAKLGQPLIEGDREVLEPLGPVRRVRLGAIAVVERRDGVIEAHDR